MEDRDHSLETPGIMDTMLDQDMIDLNHLEDEKIRYDMINHNHKISLDHPWPFLAALLVSVKLATQT